MAFYLCMQDSPEERVATESRLELRPGPVAMLVSMVFPVALAPSVCVSTHSAKNKWWPSVTVKIILHHGIGFHTPWKSPQTVLELSAMMEMPCVCPLCNHLCLWGGTSRVWLLSTWNVTDVPEEVGFLLYLILIHFHSGSRTGWCGPHMTAWGSPSHPWAMLWTLLTWPLRLSGEGFKPERWSDLLIGHRTSRWQELVSSTAPDCYLHSFGVLLCQRSG